MAVRNNSEVMKLLREQLKPVVDIVVDKIYIDNYDMIEKVIYDSYQPETYQRTNEFALDAWETTPAHKNGELHIQGDVHYAPENMTYRPDDFTHGSNYGGDVREALAEIIYQGLSGPLFGNGPWQRKRNAYNRLISYLGPRRIKNYVKEALDKCNIPYQSHNEGITIRGF